jgi:glutamyl-tRNA reductase
MERLLLVGVSLRRLPIEQRERLALAGDDLSRRASSIVGAGEVVVLATCNRVEIYAAVADPGEARRHVIFELARRAGGDCAGAVTSLRDDDVVLHLCRVAAGLDSAILGEPGILRQVRVAADTAASSRSSGPLLARLFASGIRAGRRVRSETALGEHRPSFASVSVELARRERSSLAGRRVLVVGAGALAKAVAVRFRASGCDVVVVGRAVEQAAALAASVGGRAAAMDALASELAAADVAVCCTRSSGVIVTPAQVAAARAGVRSPLHVIDLALPRDVDPAVGKIEGCTLHDLDAVEEYAAAAHAYAREDKVAAEAIAHEEAARFCAWRRSRAAGTAIASLRGRAEAIRTAELARARAKLAGLNPAQRQAVEALTAQIVNKLLHEPTVRVKETADGALVPALRDLFALEDAA